MIKEINNLTIGEVSALVEWKEVKKSLKYHYPSLKHVDNYQHCLKRIRSAPKKITKEEEFCIEASNTKWDGIEPIDYSYHTYIKKINDDTRWSMSFQPWNKLINLKVSNNTFEYYTLVDIIAHFIWEITWFGNEKNSVSRGKQLMKKVNKIGKKK